MSELFSIISSFNSQAGAWLLPYLNQIVLISLICITSIYGASVIKVIKRMVGRQGFLVRTFIFIAVTGVGLGSAVLLITPVISNLIQQLGVTMLPLVVAVIFVALGILADRKNQI